MNFFFEKLISLIGLSALDKLRYFELYQQNPSLELGRLFGENFIDNIYGTNKNPNNFFSNSIKKEIFRVLSSKDGFFSGNFIVVKLKSKIVDSKTSGPKVLREFKFIIKIVSENNKITETESEVSLELIKKYVKKGFKVICSSQNVWEEGHLYDRVSVYCLENERFKLLTVERGLEGRFLQDDPLTGTGGHLIICPTVKKSPFNFRP